MSVAGVRFRAIAIGVMGERGVVGECHVGVVKG